MQRLKFLKDQLINRAEKDMRDRTADRINIEEMAKIIDAIHHIAETEYYCAVTDAMGGSQGYGSMGYNTMSYGGGTGSSAGYNQNMGHSGLIDPLRMAMQNGTPEEREKLRRELMSMMG